MNDLQAISLVAESLFTLRLILTGISRLFLSGFISER